VREGVGFAGEPTIDGQEDSSACPGLLPKLEDDLIGGPHLSVSGKGKRDTPSG
jgi:hypothetical protein